MCIEGQSHDLLQIKGQTTSNFVFSKYIYINLSVCLSFIDSEIRSIELKFWENVYLDMRSVL